jgi:transcription elongation factor GreA
VGGVSKVPLTVRGAERLREELKKLKGTDRPKVIQAIAEARAHGDLKENAEYHAAREQQGFIEGRIQDIEGKLSNAEITDEDTGNEVTYQIVGEDEADIKAHRISINSPIARGLIGKEQGDSVAIRTPAGEKQFEIIEVKYE